MLLKSRALVLSKLKYNDTLDVVSLYTEEVGSVSFIVRRPKTRKSGIKNNLLQPLNQLEIEWDHREGNSLRHLCHMRCFYPYHSLPYDSIKASIGAFLSEFLYYALRDEHSGSSLYQYLVSSLVWLDEAKRGYANFHLVLLFHLLHFLGIYPNAANYSPQACFDMLNSCFTLAPPMHPYYVKGEEAHLLPLFLRMDFSTMHLFVFSRSQRDRLLEVMNDYYRLHIPGFPKLKSLEVLREVFNG